MVCPFYGKNEDYCDVGCGYISPHDVETIIHFCSSHFEQCPTYQELMEFHPEIAEAADVADTSREAAKSVSR